MTKLTSKLLTHRLIVALFAVAIATQAFATYIVILKDGTRYKAKAKWTVVNGKALVKLENGQTLQLDPSLIDNAKSEAATKSGYSDANVIDLNPNLPPAQQQQNQQPSLSGIKLRRGTPATTTPPPPATSASAPPPVVSSGNGSLAPDIMEKFERAYDNLGIFEKKLSSTGPRSMRAELTADTEERVFNAISATSFLMVRNAGIEGAQIDMVELFMKTTNGGAAGRFQMSKADAEALDKKTISQQEYFVRKVIY